MKLKNESKLELESLNFQVIFLDNQTINFNNPYSNLVSRRMKYERS